MKKLTQLVALAGLVALTACNKNGDDSEMADAVDDDGPMEEAGEWTDEAAEDAGESMDEAAEETAEAFEEADDSMGDEPDMN